MALEFKKLSEVTLIDAPLENSTAIIENGGEIIKAPMSSIKGSDNGAIVLTLD